METILRLAVTQRTPFSLRNLYYVIGGSDFMVVIYPDHGDAITAFTTFPLSPIGKPSLGLTTFCNHTGCKWNVAQQDKLDSRSRHSGFCYLLKYP